MRVLEVPGSDSLLVSSGGLLRIPPGPGFGPAEQARVVSFFVTPGGLKLTTASADGGTHFVLRSLPRDWQPPPPPRRFVRLVGTVDGAPGAAKLRFARVLARGTSCIATTDTSGHFTLEAVPSGTIRLFVDTYPGYAPWESTFVREYSQADTLRVRLLRGSRPLRTPRAAARDSSVVAWAGSGRGPRGTCVRVLYDE